VKMEALWGGTLLACGHATKRLMMSVRPQRAAMCNGVSSGRCASRPATSAPSSTSTQMVSMLAGPCSRGSRNRAGHQQQPKRHSR
jgi:hypothetical protein